MTQKKETLLLKLTETQKERLKRLADEQEMSMTAFITYLLKRADEKATN